MYIYICIYIYVYIYICEVYVYMCICIHTYIYIYTYLHIYAYSPKRAQYIVKRAMFFSLYIHMWSSSNLFHAAWTPYTCRNIYIYVYIHIFSQKKPISCEKSHVFMCEFHSTHSHGLNSRDSLRWTSR